MNELLKPKSVFVKSEDNFRMLQASLETREIDEDIVPIIEKFFSLPMTPIESCYGHVAKDNDPYLSYVEDDVADEQARNFQRLFKERINELATRINGEIGDNAVRIFLDEVDHGGGPKDYTLRFEIIDKNLFQEKGNEVLAIIWQKFSDYIDNLE